MTIRGREKIRQYMKKYGGSGVDFFSLKNDNDEAVVRILHEDDQDLLLELVHRVEVKGKEKWVKCLEEGCPFCEAYGRPQLKLFIFLYDYSDEKIKCWERGVTMVDFLLGFIDKYGPLNNRDYTIQRHGKKGDTKTTYQLFPGDKGPMLDSKGDPMELPERPNHYGRFVLEMTEEEMLEHVEDSLPIQRDRSSRNRTGPGF